MRELAEIREDIDNVDREIVDLIEKRMQLSGEVAEYKMAHGMNILDSSRENAVLESRADMLKDQSFRSGLQEIYRQIMKASREEQSKLMGK